MPRPFPWRWVPAAAWAALILAVSSIPGRDLPLPAGSDKAGHLAEYLVLGGLVAWALRGATLRAGAAAWGALAFFAALDEAHQALIPGRTPALGDWVADLAGLTAGLLALLAWRRACGQGREAA